MPCLTHRGFLAGPTLSLLLGLGGCISVPELDDVGDPGIANAAYPDLIPLDGVLNGAQASGQSADDLQADLQGRAARLQREADTLRAADVLDPEERARLQASVDR
ncbi:MAG: hypothetical protein AAGF79_12340 [Pseudomonadota bacterium]